MPRTTEELLKDAEDVIEHLSESKVNIYMLVSELSAKLREMEWQPIDKKTPRNRPILTCGDVPKFARISILSSITETWTYYPYGSAGFVVNTPHWWRSIDSLNIPMHRGGCKKPLPTPPKQGD